MLLARSFAVATFCFAGVVAAQEDYSATVRVVNREGTALAGQEYRLMMQSPPGLFRTVVKGELSADGVFRVEGLKGGEEPVMYEVRIGESGEAIGYVIVGGSERHQDVEIMVPPSVGEVAPDITFTELFTGEKARLSDFRGQVVLLDFWASWCPPCQKPMGDNQAAMVAHKDAWRDKATILALSIDDTPEIAREHIEKNGWTAIRNYFSSEGGAAWESDAVKMYGVLGIPTAFLIDRDGKIAWQGNPGHADVVELIDAEFAKAR